MDSSFNASPSMFNKGSFTPRTRQSSVSSAMSGRKSLHGGLKKGIGSSRFSLAGGRAAQSQPQFITKTDLLTVEPFGLPLPVLVNEALTFGAGNAAAVTISSAPNGWAWAVAGRRLLVWQHTSVVAGAAEHDLAASGRTHGAQRRPPASGQCRELTLPHCDIGHKAALVCVFLGDGGGQQMASCLAVSPAGDVRYWPSIAHDGSSIDAGSVMDGQEFDAIVALPGVGYVLATTTCNLLLLQLQLNNGRHTIVHRPVRPPTGFLGGIGKRFASIIIGMNSNQEREHKFIKLCATPSRTGADWNVSVLADRWIQRWSLSGTNGGAAAETYLFEDFDMFKKVRDGFHQKLWSQRDIGELDVRLLDMHATDARTVLVLAAAINATHTPQFHYALCTFVETAPSAAAASNAYALQNFCQLRHSTFVSGVATLPEIVPSMRLLVDDAGGAVYVYDEKYVLLAQLSGGGQLSGSGEPSDKVEWCATGERIMSGMLFDRAPVFFLRQNGFVCVRPVSAGGADGDNNDDEYLNGSTIMDGLDGTLNGNFLSQSMLLSAGGEHANLSLFELNPDEVYDDSDAVAQLKAAFIYHLKKNAAKCAEVLAELLDAGTPEVGGLDAIVTKIARDLVDDVPAADPRWEEQIGQQQQQQTTALGSSASLQIIQQLKEKKLVLQHFVEFLHSVALWPRLSACADRSGGASTSAIVQRPTALILSDISEKVAAAIALKKVHASQARLIDDAIQTVLKQRNESTGDNGPLTAQDLFYVRVSRVHEIVKVLADRVSGPSATDVGGAQQCAQLADVNAVVLALLGEVHKSRVANYAQFAMPAAIVKRFEYVPWTAQSGRVGVRDALQQLVAGTLRTGARATGEPELRQRHYRQMVELIDYLLDGRKSYLDSVQDSDKYAVLLQQYEAQRGDLIQPLVQDGQFELATKLAEKYLDFQILVQICDSTANQQRLDEYIRKYAHLNFAQFAINWHLRQDKRGDLFERFKHNQADLSRFLADHPSLAWVQAVFNGDNAKAGRVLVALADGETELVARKKTMLSLAKLVTLAADEASVAPIATINADLRLIEYQAALSGELLEVFGYEGGEEQKVLKAEEIINLLIAEENTNATEAEFRKALEMLAYVDDPEDVRSKIWCAAINRDDWSPLEAAQEDLQNTHFYKLVDLCFFMDSDLSEFLPPLEQLLAAPELAHLVASKSFQYLFKLTYEYIVESYGHRL